MTSLQVVAPGTTSEQRMNGAAAALAVLNSSGVEAAAAFTAYRQMEDVTRQELEMEVPPAMVRASVIWGRAVQAAVLACYGIAATVPVQLLLDA